MSDRVLEIDGLCNARDLGGLPLADGVVPRGVLLRGETVVHVTPLGREQMLALGVDRVLDLREPFEAAEDGMGPFADLYGTGEIALERVSLIGLPSWTQDPVGHVHDAATVGNSYARYLSVGGFHLAAALSRFAWSDSAMYVHCAVGKDRTGVVCALLLKLAGAEDAAVLEDYLATGPAVREVITRLGERPAYQHVADPNWDAQMPSAEGMTRFLTHLETHGGARGWLLDRGMDPETMDRLVARLQGRVVDEIAVAS
jgi:hypothetical protein